MPAGTDESGTATGSSQGMDSPTTPPPVRSTILEVPGATLTYDVRGDLGDGHRPLFLIGSPMDASGFTTLASFFTDRPVVTYDPRGCARSTKDDPGTPSTPEEHADDVRRVVENLGTGPVDLFASSGGAVNALAVVAHHPEVVSTVVAHEPPALPVLPDAEAALAATRDVHETYQHAGLGPAMAKFIALTSHRGPVGPDYPDGAAPDPQAYGLPTQDDGDRTDPLLGQNLVSCCSYAPDTDALREAPVRLVVAVGEESGQEIAGRAGRALAQRLGVAPAVFPGGHAGFLGGEYGMQGQPEPFARRLREVLDEV